MLVNKVHFDRICENIPYWKWNELKVGLEKSIISSADVISYAVQILSETVEHFDRVVELSIAEDDEVEPIVSMLALVEGEDEPEIINSKWIFAIIYDAYIYLNDEVYSLIDDVYTEFEYPEEISNLIGYMPCDDSRTMETRLNEYIEGGKKIWC